MSQIIRPEVTYRTNDKPRMGMNQEAADFTFLRIIQAPVLPDTAINAPSKNPYLIEPPKPLSAILEKTAETRTIDIMASKELGNGLVDQRLMAFCQHKSAVSMFFINDALQFTQQVRDTLNLIKNHTIPKIREQSSRILLGMLTRIQVFKGEGKQGQETPSWPGSFSLTGKVPES